MNKVLENISKVAKEKAFSVDGFVVYLNNKNQIVKEFKDGSIVVVKDNTGSKKFKLNKKTYKL